MNLEDQQGLDAQLRRAIERSNQYPIPCRILLYVNIGPLADGARIEPLYREIELVAPLLARDRSIARLQWSDAAFPQLAGERCQELQQCLAQHFAIGVEVLADSAASRPLQGAARPSPGLDVLGLGPGACSEFAGLRSYNLQDIAQYCAALDQGRLPVARAERIGDLS